MPDVNKRYTEPSSPSSPSLTNVTQEVVTTPDLVLNVYDPNAKYIPEYRKTLRSGSWAEDWGGPTCLRIYGIERPELWGGSCVAVTVTLRHRNNFVDLSNRGRCPSRSRKSRQVVSCQAALRTSPED